MATPTWLTNAAKLFSRRRYFPESRTIHVTELLNPARMVLLKSQHHNEIQTPPEDLLPAIVGTAFHQFVEGLDDAGYAEDSLSVGIAGWTLLGTPDWYDAKTLRDYKTTRVWSSLLGGKREWEEQLNIYRYMLKLCRDETIENIEVHAVYLDWSRNQMMRAPDYPRGRLEVIPIRVWPFDDVQAFIRRRLAALSGEEAPVCSPEERWQRDETWAVMKKGRKSAVKLFPTEQEALAFMGTPGSPASLYIEHREGTPVRCLDWCPVKQFCDFGSQL